MCAHVHAIWEPGVDLYPDMMWGTVGPVRSSKGSGYPPGSSPPVPPPSSPHSSGPAAGSPPPAVSLRVLSVGEEESSLMDGSALDAAHLCFPS